MDKNKVARFRGKRCTII